MIAVLVNGLADGMLLFLIASGLTLVLGIMGVGNFAHGAFFGVGAYVLSAQLPDAAPTVLRFVIGVLIAALATGVLGVLSEYLVFRPLAELPPTASLLGTFGLLLFLQGGTQGIWGIDPIAVTRPDSLNTTLNLFGTAVPVYSVVIFGVGAVVAAGLVLIIRRTQFGRVVTAIAEDRQMASLLGIRVKLVTRGVFFVGLFLAGLGGALAAPTMSLTPDIAVTYIIPAFAIVIIGGFGSIEGSVIGSLVIGLSQAALVSYVPSVGPFTVYLVMALMLSIRPQGLFGRLEIGERV
ncbi:MAG TPA: branched-chain amino acid ABC transporter permease [Marmoricola sp.]|nr:branched-chain amino acid ABC transporter permease [Marmoricola sp.]